VTSTKATPRHTWRPETLPWHMPSHSPSGVNTGNVSDFRRRQQELFGARIRQLREAAGLKGAELAALAGVAQPTISKIENGRILPSANVVERIADSLQLSPEARDELLEELTRVNTDIATWRRAGGRGEAKQKMIGERDRTATLRRSYHPTVIPGLIQTAEYARCVFARSMFLTPEERSRAVAARLDRQTVLYSGDHRFEFLIHEAALRARLGPKSLMLAQFDRLTSLSSLETVDISIVPFHVELPRVVPNGFTIYDDERVVVETFTSEFALGDERDVESYRRLFADLRAIAVSGPEAAALLASIAAEYR
jgi:transcriptional regulator with XRE-family HTH domain